MRHRRVGISILELLLVIAIVGILLGLGFWSIPRDRIAVNQAAERFERDVERARFNAINFNVSVVFAVDDAENGYEAVPAGGGSGGFVVPDVASAFPGVLIQVVDGNPVWEFDARGVALGGSGTVTVRFVHRTTGADRVLEVNRYGKARGGT